MIYVSPSGLATYENCPQAYYLERILRVKTVLTSASMGFGSATGRAIELFLVGQLRGKAVDPVQVFRDEWKRFTDRHAVRYPKGFTADSLDASGARLMELFPESWKASGFTLLLDANGEPMLERKLRVNIGNNVVLVTKLDQMVMSPEGETILLDTKATAAESSVEFALMSDQLTAYNLAVNAHASRLGIQPPDKVGYWEMLRRSIPKQRNRGEGPVVRPALVVPARTQRQLDQFVHKAHHVADLIRAARFDPTSRMAWNSPCSNCSLTKLCARGETDGLVFASPEAKQSALALAA